MKSARLLARFVLTVALIVAVPASSLAQVRVIISGGFRGAYEMLLPEFEKTSGVRVTTTEGPSIGTGPRTIPNQIRNGAAADVVILAREGLDELIREKRIVAGSDIDLARSLIGMIVRAGTPKPDIRTVETFTQALLRAPSIAVSTSASGVYLTTTLFPRLGVSEAIAKKVIVSEEGASEVGTGRAVVGLQQVSEVLRVPNAEYVGTIPSDLQLVTVFSAAIVSGSAQMDASKRLIAHLASAGAAAIVRKSGMEPLNTR
jgi:molybdate transport system substrate-binding protein